MSKLELDAYAELLRENSEANSKKQAKIKSFTFIDLFAGIGGMRLGFESQNGICVFSSEWDTHSQKTYEANFGETPAGDITKIRSVDIPDFDLLLAGFPCQPFSSIGRRQGFSHETQGTLFFDVERIIREKRPKAFLLENVKGLISHDSGNTLNVILRHLSDAGYALWARVLNASDFGVPQARERIYIVGFDRQHFGDDIPFSWPAKIPLNVDIGSFLETDITDRSISKHLQDVYIYKKDDGRPQVIDSSTKGAVKTLVASYHKVQRISGTFVADGPTGLRLLSENECKAIMGFPADFKIPVSRTQAFRQFGNSVAVPVIAKIAEQMSVTLRKLKAA